MTDTLIRFARREHNVALIDKCGLQDTRLSWRAKGLLAHCMSLPAHHRISQAVLLDAGPDGIRVLRHGLDELREAGYAKYERIKGDRGRILGSQWTIYETPETGTTDRDAQNVYPGEK